MCHLPQQLPSSLTVGPALRHTKVACHIHVSFVPALTETRRSGILFFILFHTGSGGEILGEVVCTDSTQQGELRSSAMSGGTDRREDEQVPQFYGRIDENFAEWETDVRLWQVEFKVEDSDRLGPKLYRRGLHGQPKNHCENKARNTRCCNSSQWTTSSNASKTTDMENFLKELGQEALDNYFDMRQGQG